MRMWSCLLVAGVVSSLCVGGYSSPTQYHQKENHERDSEVSKASTHNEGYKNSRGGKKNVNESWKNDQTREDDSWKSKDSIETDWKTSPSIRYDDDKYQTKKVSHPPPKQEVTKGSYVAPKREYHESGDENKASAYARDQDYTKETRGNGKKHPIVTKEESHTQEAGASAESKHYEIDEYDYPYYGPRVQPKPYYPDGREGTTHKQQKPPKKQVERTNYEQYRDYDDAPKKNYQRYNNDDRKPYQEPYTNRRCYYPPAPEKTSYTSKGSNQYVYANQGDFYSKTPYGETRYEDSGAGAGQNNYENEHERVGAYY